MLHATLRDGLNSGRDPNSVFKIHRPSVLLDTLETDPAKRYKMLGAIKRDRSNCWQGARGFRAYSSMVDRGIAGWINGHLLNHRRSSALAVPGSITKTENRV